MRRWGVAAFVVLACLGVVGCSSIGPRTLQPSRLEYNEVIKSTTEEQLLLNIVRLRYMDTPSSLSVSAIAAQYERAHSAAIIPFFTAAGGDIHRSYATVLPQGQISSAERPTFSLTPLDDQEFTRKLFTPIPVDAVAYLAKTTWPISTVFRLYLENLNWVPNAQTASGPTPHAPPEFTEFRRGVDALQTLQNAGHLVLGMDERTEAVASPLPAASIRAGDLVEAAKNGLEFQSSQNGSAWTLVRKTSVPVIRVAPEAHGSAAFSTLAAVFRLQPGLDIYPITQERLSPFPNAYPRQGVAQFDLETRSLLQALYFISHGVEVPEDHYASQLARRTAAPDGGPFDWQQVMSGLFRVRHARAEQAPAGARVAIPYRGYWFYIDESDHESKSTFSLLVELSRLELNQRAGGAPLLTLPVGAR